MACGNLHGRDKTQFIGTIKNFRYHYNTFKAMSQETTFADEL